MGLKNFWNKMMGNAGGSNNDDEYAGDDDMYEDDEVEDTPRQEAEPYRQTAAIGSSQQARPLKMVIVEPEAFDDAQNIADYLRDCKPVVINFESTEPDIAKRIVDFVSGATYALDGNIQKVGTDIFLCVPNNVTVDRSKHEYTDFADPSMGWKDRSNQPAQR